MEIISHVPGMLHNMTRSLLSAEGALSEVTACLLRASNLPGAARLLHVAGTRIPGPSALAQVKVYLKRRWGVQMSWRNPWKRSWMQQLRLGQC